MSTPLGENNAHIDKLCNLLNLGQPHHALTSIAGGFHHRVWRLETQRGVFAVKQLAPDTDLDDMEVINHYNVTEAIAREFAKRKIAVVSALFKGEKSLQLVDTEGYLVYQWTDAIALGDGEVSTHHALSVARLLAKMHLADIKVPGVKSEFGEPSGENEVDDIVRIATELGLKVAPLLSEQRPMLIRIARQYQAALPLLGKRQVVSHGDLDQKNVLWDSSDNPIIIDWESAHEINPTFEGISVALDWSGITADFDYTMYSQFIAAYTAAGGTITKDLVEAALHCVIGTWLDWLMYNIGRIVNLQNPKQRALGAEQIEFTLPVMAHLDRLIPELLKDRPKPATAPVPSK